MQKNIVALRKHTRLDVSPESNMRIYQAVIHSLAPSDAWSCRTSCILFCHALLLLIHARLACSFAKSKCALRLYCRSTDNSRKTLSAGAVEASFVGMGASTSLALQHPRDGTNKQIGLSPDPSKCVPVLFTAPTSRDAEGAANNLLPDVAAHQHTATAKDCSSIETFVAVM